MKQIILCLLSFVSAAYAQHNLDATSAPIHWQIGQQSVAAPLASPLSHDRVVRQPAPGIPTIGSTVFEKYFLVVSGDNYVSIGKNVSSLEQKTGLYTDKALSGQDYLTEVVSGDCTVKGIYIFPANQRNHAGIVVVSTSQFPRYDRIEKPQRPTVLYKFILKRRKLRGRNAWYLSFKAAHTLDRYYCQETDYIPMVSKVAEDE